MVSKKSETPKSWHTCWDCAIKFGGEMGPEDGKGITVMAGPCPDCGKEATLIPLSDFSWPKLGKKAWFD